MADSCLQMKFKVAYERQILTGSSLVGKTQSNSARKITMKFVKRFYIRTNRLQMCEGRLFMQNTRVITEQIVIMIACRQRHFLDNYSVKNKFFFVSNIQRCSLRRYMQKKMIINVNKMFK